jgi:hypothetical protein
LLTTRKQLRPHEHHSERELNEATALGPVALAVHDLARRNHSEQTRHGAEALEEAL